MKVLNLKKEPVIHCIHIKEYVEIIKRNGCYILYLIECFMKKKNDDRKAAEPKNLQEYVRFRKYDWKVQEIQRNVNENVN